MGLYDRDYSRRQEPGLHLSAPRSATMQLVVITVAIYLAQVFTGGDASPVTRWLSLDSDWFRQPWKFYQLLTYGFLHDPGGIEHILINMFVLWMFGREIEQRYGRTEFLSFYLSAVIIAGLAWSVIETATGSVAVCLGASGAIAGVVALFALNFPHRKVLFMLVIPMPMWVAAVIGLAFDIRGAMLRSGNVAFTAHLAGALFGLYYYYRGWPVGRWLTGGMGSLPTRRKPKLRVHEPDEAEDEDDDLSRKLDEILQKIQDHGQDSLSWSERRLLERASRRYQEKRK
jgi:membrane associated rhomboid family serine protease